MGFREMSPVRKSALVVIAVFVALTGVAVTGAVSQYLEKRAHAKAEAAEFWRRERMTPEQRLAEDAAKAAAARAAAQAAKATAAEAERRVIMENGKQACLAEWMASLRDPDSARLEGYEGVIVGADEYQGQIFGRAKNGFGGYVRASWWCRAFRSGTTVRVLSITQAKS